MKTIEEIRQDLLQWQGADPANRAIILIAPRVVADNDEGTHYEVVGDVEGSVTNLEAGLVSTFQHDADFRPLVGRALLRDLADSLSENKADSATKEDGLSN